MMEKDTKQGLGRLSAMQRENREIQREVLAWAARQDGAEFTLGGVENYEGQVMNRALGARVKEAQRAANELAKESQKIAEKAEEKIE